MTRVGVDVGGTFTDLVAIGRDGSLTIRKVASPPPDVAREDVIGAQERMGPDGVLIPLSGNEVARIVRATRTLAPEAVAISFLFAFRHPAHEQQIATALRAALPGIPVAASNEVL